MKKISYACLFLFGFFSTNAFCDGYMGMGIGITTQSAESQYTGQTTANSDLSPDIDVTIGYSITGLFIGANYFSNKSSKGQNQTVNGESLKTEQVGTTKGVGYTIGLSRPGFSLLYTDIRGATQKATIKSELTSTTDPARNANIQSNVELSGGKGFQIDFFFGFKLNTNVYFGPKLSYLKINYSDYKVNQQASQTFVNLSQSKFTPKIGVVAKL